MTLDCNETVGNFRNNSSVLISKATLQLAALQRRVIFKSPSKISVFFSLSRRGVRKMSYIINF